MTDINDIPIPPANKNVEKIKRAFTRADMEKAYRDLTLLEYESAERDMAQYFRSGWPVLEPKTKLLINWHHDALAEYLMACYTRQIKRLVINEPPRGLKSTEVSVCFPTWVWTKNASERFLCASYAQSLATKHNIDRRTLIRSSWYQTRWGHKFKMSDDQDAKTEFNNDQRGHMIATSMIGTGTGKGGTFVIFDDPQDPKRAESDKLRQATIEAYDSTFSTRLDDKINGVMILVMQRLHDKDMTDHVLAEGGWQILKLPAIATTRTVIDFPISKRQVVREVGDILHVAREDAAELKRMEKKLTQYGFAGQYQQEPAPRQGGILKIAYWKRYDAQTLPKRFDYIIDDWDFNFKDLESADWVCGQVWGVVGPNRYLLYMKYRPIGFLESLKAVAQFRIMWPGINETIIEDKANGPAIMQALKKHIAGLKEFNPQGSKSERAVAITSQLEGGNVFIPTAELSRAWDIDEAYLIGGYDSPVDAYIGNCAKFPRVDQDGDVDCTSMALLYLNNKTNTLDMLSKLGQW